MTDAPLWELVARGLLIGVGVGITNALILGAYQRWKRYRTRREEIRYIRRFLKEFFERNGNVTPPVHAGDAPTADQFRFALVRRDAAELDVAIGHRTSGLDTDEVFELRKNHRSLSDMVAQLDAAIDGLPPLSLPMLREVYRGFADIKWLELPETPYSEREVG